MVVRLDDIDYKILEILRKNGRASYTEIAKAVGLSEAAVRKRVNSMAKRGIIRRFSIEYSVEGEVRALVLGENSPSQLGHRRLPRRSGVWRVWKLCMRLQGNTILLCL